MYVTHLIGLHFSIVGPTVLHSAMDATSAKHTAQIHIVSQTSILCQAYPACHSTWMFLLHGNLRRMRVKPALANLAPLQKTLTARQRFSRWMEGTIDIHK